MGVVGVGGWGGQKKKKKQKNPRRTRWLSDQSSNKEGHSHFRALPKITRRVRELQQKRQTDKLKKVSTVEGQ